jgi:hypothetical protein
VVGALAALVLVTAWHGRTSADERAAAGADAKVAALQADETGGLPVNVQCAQGQRALVRQLATPQGTASSVECVSAFEQDALVANGVLLSAPNAYTPSPRVVPAVATTAAPERVVYRERRAPSGRSWKKTAMVIGGSAGAGAGVGALAGGKKGALIGAAIGGGAATLYEAAKRR